jgi:hypothetical protein
MWFSKMIELLAKLETGAIRRKRRTLEWKVESGLDHKFGDPRW